MFKMGGNGLKLATLGVLALVVLGGCEKEDKFPPQPRIAFKSFEPTANSATLTISFTDGDGDIGLNDSDDQPPFDSTSIYYHNFFVTYEELQEGEWVQPQLELENNYRIPRITPTGQNKTLEGDIAVELFWPIDPGGPYDTVRFAVKLVDRSLNESNTVYTESIIVQ